MRIRLSCLAVFLLAASAVARAQETPPPAAEAPPAAAPEMKAAPEAAGAPTLDSLRSLAGTWRCKGQVTPGANSPAHATITDVHIQPDLGGAWLGIRGAERKTAANPHPAAFLVHWGYDSEHKRLIAGSLGNQGDYATQASQGWEGDTLVWLGPYHTGSATLTSRDTFVRHGGAIVHTFELEMDGSWQKLVEETCSRAGKPKK